jgi:ribosome biogenesis GTPase
VEDENGKTFECKIKGKFRIKGIKSTNPVAVGDRVEFTIQTASANENEEKIGLITAILERKNYIIRRSINLSKQSHIIAANIDQAVLVVTLSFPVTTTTFIDRYLASAEAYRIPVLIVFNKTDRYDTEQNNTLKELVALYENIGYKCLTTSAKTLQGLKKLEEALKN